MRLDEINSSTSNVPEGAGDVGKVEGPVVNGVAAWGKSNFLLLVTESNLTDNIGPLSRCCCSKAVFIIALDVDTPIYANIRPFGSMSLQGIDSVQL